MDIAHQAPLSMGFPRQEYWSGLLFPSPGDLSDPGVELMSLALAVGFFTTVPPTTVLKSKAAFFPELDLKVESQMAATTIFQD